MATQNSAQSLDIEVALTRSEKFINKYKKQLIIGFVSILVIVVACSGGYYWMQQREAGAQAQVALGQKFFMQQQWDQALNGDSVKTKDAFKGFLKVADEYSMTDGANIARLQAGICYYHKGDYKKAIEQLEKFSPKGDATVSANAIAALGDAYACDNQLDKAVDKFKEAAKKADNPGLSPVYLLKAAGILEKQNKKADANALYTSIKTDYPDFALSAPVVNDGTVSDAEIDKYIERTK